MNPSCWQLLLKPLVLSTLLPYWHQKLYASILTFYMQHGEHLLYFIICNSLFSWVTFSITNKHYKENPILILVWWQVTMNLSLWQWHAFRYILVQLPFVVNFFTHKFIILWLSNMQFQNCSNNKCSGHTRSHCTILWKMPC